MSVLTESEDLRQKAIALLVEERTAIEEQLARLGYDGAAPTSAKPRACGKCGEIGHTARTCTKTEAPRVAAFTASL